MPGIVLLIVSMVISLSIYKDYGLSWDEDLQRDIGLANYHYVFSGDPLVNEKDHGPGFELPLIIIEKALGLKDSRDIYFMRHLVQNMFFLLSMFCGYILMYHVFKKQSLACLGFLILVYTPRIFAHSFFNSKDIPFLSMFLVSMAVSFWAFAKNKPLAYLLLGMILGYTTSIRIMSIMLAGFLGLFFIIDVVNGAIAKKNVAKVLWFFLLFIAGFCITLYICWPALWGAPISNFIEFYSSLSHFRWPGEVLLNGEIVSALHLPWTYLPTWFCITTPLLWLLLGFTGIILFIAAFINKPLRFIGHTTDRFFLLAFLCFSTPVLMVILLGSVVYDDWRHVYFIYPSFVLFILYAVDRLQQYKAAIILNILIVLQFAIVAAFMVRSHPFQNVYFNEIVSHKKESLRKNYELDYWGTSVRKCLEYILAHDKSDNIKVNDWFVVPSSINMLPEADRKRVRPIAGDEQPDYYIALFRTRPDKYPPEKRIFEIKASNSTIARVYKLKE